ncbi:TrbM/KikA/MpfK family conjugal transfer protein [Citrobacter freundii]|nr:TrbM/KikA/MpfK family conjugal transfer protein [Citrobacter freundii]
MNSLKTNNVSKRHNMKTTLSILLLSATSLVMTAPAKAADPCQQVLCLSGVMAGKGVVSGCSGAVGDYFSIIETKHGSFLPDHTAKKRKKQLDKCPAAGADVIEKINNKFGRLRGL